MRFRYIDGRGKEIAVDSVEALAARIELGAVSSSTELYDAGTDTWGPADSHPVYRQLLAEAAARDIVGAPPVPGVLPIPGHPPRSAEPGLPETVVPAAGTETAAGITPAPPTDPLPEPVQVAQLEPEFVEPELTLLTAAGELQGTTEPYHSPESGGATAPLLDPPADLVGSGPAPGEADDLAMALPETLVLEGGLDFSTGAVGAMRQDGPPPGRTGDPWERDDGWSRESASPHDTVSTSGSPAADADDAKSSDAWTGWGPSGKQVPVETSPDWPGDDAFTPSSPDGAWPDSVFEDSEPEEVTLATRVGDILGAPSVQWGFLASSFLVMAFFGSAVAPGLVLRGVITILGVAVLGAVTGAFLWRDPVRRTLIPAATFGLIVMASVPLFLLGSRAQAASPQARTSVRTPTPRTTSPAKATDMPPANPGELAMEGRALDGVIEGVDSLAIAYGLSRRPPEWLQGVYLANASQFPEVWDYWERYGAYLEEIRSQDADWFRESYTRRLHAAGVSSGAISGLVERGMTRFLASAERREDLYATMQDLVDGSLELHALLLEHEDAIDYEPWDSNSVSADPVVEAVPTDPKVEERMWSMIGRIALALEELTDLGETSPAHLQAALIDSIRAIH